MKIERFPERDETALADQLAYEAQSPVHLARLVMEACGWQYDHMGGVWRLVLEWRVVGQDQIESQGFSIHLEVLRHASCPYLVFKERGFDEECRLFLKAKHRVFKRLENNTALLVAGRWLP